MRGWERRGLEAKGHQAGLSPHLPERAAIEVAQVSVTARRRKRLGKSVYFLRTRGFRACSEIIWVYMRGDLSDSK